MSQSDGKLRIKRTHKLLRTALIDLIEERDFDTLTVGEIAERAMVSRAGFYRYYQDKYDLVEQLFEEAVPQLMNGGGEEALTEVLSRRVQQPSSCVQHGKQVAIAYDRLAPELSASLLIEIITRWLEQS